MKRTLLILSSLALGLAAGLLVAQSASPGLAKLASALGVIGTAWVNLLRMTVVPLIPALLIVGIGSSRDAGVTGRIAGWALGIFLALYCAVTAFTMLAAPPLLAGVASSVAHVGAGASEVAAPAEAVSTAEQIAKVIPVNPFQAAAQGDILPLVVFSLLFALAVSRIAPEGRRAVLAFFGGVCDAMLTIVRWALVVAPIGVFCVALPLARQLGASFVGDLAVYIVVASVLCVPVMAALYPLATILGRVPLRKFALGSVAAQSVAASTQSSVASLPAMIEGAEEQMRIPPQVAGVVLPLAVSVFRLANPLSHVVAVLFAARLHGIALGTGQLAMLFAASVLVSIAGVGLPSGAAFVSTHSAVFLAVGLPLDTIPILFAVDTIPDLVQTVANVTGDLAATAVVSRQAAPLAPDAGVGQEAGPVSDAPGGRTGEGSRD